jgi:hypothetical protein
MIKIILKIPFFFLYFNLKILKLIGIWYQILYKKSKKEIPKECFIKNLFHFNFLERTIL